MKQYLPYALGELLLVVFGILIALQINNWNEERIQDNRAMGYAASLLAEVEENIEILEVRQNGYRSGVEHTKRYMKMMNRAEDQVILNDTLIAMARLMGPINLLTLSKSTYDDLINSGNLETFDNDHLRELIMVMGRKFEVVDNSMERSDVFWEQLSAYYVQHTNLTAVMNLMLSEDLPTSDIALNRDAFIGNLNYVNLLAMRLFRYDRADRAARSLSSTLSELKSELEAMLQKT